MMLIKKMLKNIFILTVIDVVMAPLLFVSALLMLIYKRMGAMRLKRCKKLLLKLGLYPVTDHYYEPLFDERKLLRPLSENRNLCINWNIEKQIQLIGQLNYSHELTYIPYEYVDDITFSFDNVAFGAGDAEYWYSLLRYKKPKRIIEVGSGHSTKIARLAILKNMDEDSNYFCKHICIEPYENPWLEKIGSTIIREKIENVPIEIFKELEKDDILFIDSSHMIKPQGDILFEYLELIPILNEGVIVHIHDVFSPKDYPEEWILDRRLFWNEQYLLEAFLTSNNEWEVIGTLNLLHNNYYANLKAISPSLTPDRAPGSFYMVKVKSA